MTYIIYVEDGGMYQWRKAYAGTREGALAYLAENKYVLPRDIVKKQLKKLASGEVVFTIWVD